MSSLVVAVALCETDMPSEKYMAILQKNPYLLSLPSVNTSLSELEECGLYINSRSTGTPEPDEFDVINASTPKKFAGMVKHRNQSAKHVTNISTSCLTPITEENEEIMHTGRNIMDLGGNLLESMHFYKPAVLPLDSQGFFQNRSQIHRVNSPEQATSKYTEIYENLIPMKCLKYLIHI
ncbi:hypothetical protein Trydic_g7977 [Trypoxylus dichotomus]